MVPIPDTNRFVALMIDAGPVASMSPTNFCAVMIPVKIALPTTFNLAVGFVEPIPRFPEVGMNPISVSAMPIEVTPMLLAKVGYTGDAVKT